MGSAVANLLVNSLSDVTSISSSYSGQLRCSSVHSPSGSALETDAPTDNQGKGERFSPTDLIATALNTCVLTIMGIVAERHNWDLKGCAARVEKVMTSEAPRKIALLDVWIELPPHIDSKERKILKKAAENCPVKLSLDGAVPMSFHWS
ncbi:OsmC family protein [Synechococcus sp. CC9616]|uniref:OsmC family protein n=1 Tax=Synechococcus sp. CC9616 TaxID=110663 RepID=UPI0004AE84BF